MAKFIKNNQLEDYFDSIEKNYYVKNKKLKNSNKNNKIKSFKEK